MKTSTASPVRQNGAVRQIHCPCGTVEPAGQRGPSRKYCKACRGKKIQVYQSSYRNGTPRPPAMRESGESVCSICSNPFPRPRICSDCSMQNEALSRITGDRMPPRTGKETQFTALCEEFRSHMSRAITGRDGMVLEDEEREFLQAAMEALKNASVLKQNCLATASQPGQNSRKARHAWLWAAEQAAVRMGGTSEAIRADGETHGLERLLSEIDYVEKNARIKSLNHRKRPNSKGGAKNTQTGRSGMTSAESTPQPSQP